MNSGKKVYLTVAQTEVTVFWAVLHSPVSIKLEAIFVGLCYGVHNSISGFLLSFGIDLDLALMVIEYLWLFFVAEDSNHIYFSC